MNISAAQDMVAPLARQEASLLRSDISAEESMHTEILPSDTSQRVEQINEVLSSFSRQLSISVDEDSGATVMKVLDSETGDLVRQIPGDDVLRIMKHAHEAFDQSIAFLLDERA